MLLLLRRRKRMGKPVSDLAHQACRPSQQQRCWILDCRRVGGPKVKPTRTGAVASRRCDERDLPWWKEAASDDGLLMTRCWRCLVVRADDGWAVVGSLGTLILAAGHGLRRDGLSFSSLSLSLF